MDNSEENQPIASPAYFASLAIENVKCFKDKQTIDLSIDNVRPSMCTVILGNNNTGKTTLLKCLANLELVKEYIFYVDESDKLDVLFKGNLKKRHKDERFSCFIFYEENYKEKQYRKSTEWGVTLKGTTAGKFSEYGKFIIYGYGTNRRAGKNYLSGKDAQDNTETLFDDSAALNNIEEWLLQLCVAKGLKKNQAENAEKILNKIKDVLICGILPDVQDFDIDNTDDFKFFIKFKTDYGWVKLKELGYGYRSITTLVLDLLKKMFERYPESDNPLHEPAIVLIDEIDLHLHPEWQRKIIKFLSEQFPKTQFIVTAHSPLIVQSAENINLVILEKQDDHVIINQPDLTTYKGWSVEEILSDLMGLDEKIKSDDYLSLIKTFNKAVAKDDYLIAKETYDKLDKLLHHNNIQRELLELQLNSLSQETA